MSGGHGGAGRVQALQTVFQNVDDIQSVLMRCAASESGLTRETLTARLADTDGNLQNALSSKSVELDDVTDLVFDVFDTSGDGVVQLGAEFEEAVFEEYSSASRRAGAANDHDPDAGLR